MQKLERKTEKIGYFGLEAYTDAYALDGTEIMFMSMFGNKTAVKGLWASLMSGNSIDLFGETEQQIYVRRDSKWRVHTKNLVSGIAHAMLIPQQLRLKHVKDEFVVIADSQEKIKETFFLYLNKVSKIPLKKEWTEWLLVKIRSEDMLRELETLNVTGFYYGGSDEMLGEIVTSGIRNKVIS